MTTKSTLDRFETRAQETKSRIFVQTLDLIERYGAEGLTVRKIADASDVSPALIIQYFGSKDRLLQQVFELKNEALVRDLKTWISRSDAATSFDCLMLVARYLLERDMSSPRLTMQVLAYSFRWDREEENAFLSRLEPIISLVIDCLMKSDKGPTRDHARDGVLTFFLCYTQTVRYILVRDLTMEQGLKLLARPIRIVADGIDHLAPRQADPLPS